MAAEAISKLWLKSKAEGQRIELGAELWNFRSQNGILVFSEAKSGGKMCTLAK